MKAAVHTRYGDPREVLQVRDLPEPEVGDDQVLVRVRAAAVHADVWHVVAGRPILVRLMGAGLLRPRDTVPGTDLAGEVVEVGSTVTRFRPGDVVFGSTLRKMRWRSGGTYAELAVAPQETLQLVPGNVTLEQAASVPTSGYIALINLRASAAVRPGHRVLVNGAGGAVGSIAVQVAKARGAVVAAVDRADKLAMLERLGADRVVDYRERDVTAGDERYDLILDVASTLPLADCKRILTPTGIYVIIGHEHYGTVGGPVLGDLLHFFSLVARAPFDRHLPSMSGSTPGLPEVMAELERLLADGTITPIVHRAFPLGEVREAMGFLQQGGGPGRVVLVP